MESTARFFYGKKKSDAHDIKQSSAKYAWLEW